MSEIEGKAYAIGIERSGEVTREVLSQEVLATAAIEGEKLDLAAMHSSVMRRLGTGDSGSGRYDRHVDGLVEVLSDAATSFQQPRPHQ